MDATMALLVQGCACAPTAHPAVTAAMASARNPEVGAPIACDAGPYVEFDTMLEQMAEQLQTTEPRHGAEPTVAAESAKRNGHGARAIRADAEVDTQPAGDDDDDGDGDEDADGPGSAALRQMTMMPAGPAVTAPIQTHTMRWSTRRVEGAWNGRMAGEVPALPNGLAAAGTEELMTAEEGRVSQPEGDHVPVDQTNGSTAGQSSRAAGRTPADKAPVRESATVSTARPVDGGVRTAPQVGSRNVHISARVGRDEPARNGSLRPTGMPTTEPGLAERAQERTVVALQERETARPEGRTIVLPDMRGTADPDGRARVAPERLTMAATEEPMATGSEQPTEAQSTEGQGRVSQQLGDRTSASMDARAPQPEGAHLAMDQVNESTVGRGSRVTTGTLAERTPIRESGTASAERPVAGRVRTAPQVKPENVRASARVGRDEPALNGSPGPADVPVTEPDMAPRVQEPTAAAMQERSTARPERRTMVLPHVRGAADPDGRARVAPERLTMAATEEPMATGSEQPTEAQSTEGQGRVSQQLGDRTSASMDARAPQPEGAHLAMDQVNESTVGRGSRVTTGTLAERTPIRESGTASAERPVAGRVRTAPQVEPKNAETAESRQTGLQPTAPRREGAMTALVESLARHRNLPNPLWEEGLQKAGRREPETNDRPDLAVVVGPTHTMIPAEGPDVSQTPQAARPALTEPAGSSVTRQIAAHVSARAAQGGGEFRARLVPEHLGSVQIRVRVVRGVCTADIRADDAEVARYIESHSSDLKVSLAEHGIDLSGLSVSSRSRAQEGWGAATLSHSESDWSAPSWNGANARQQYAAAAFAGGNWRDGRGERRGALMERRRYDGFAQRSKAIRWPEPG